MTFAVVTVTRGFCGDEMPMLLLETDDRDKAESEFARVASPATLEQWQHTRTGDCLAEQVLKQK